MRWLSRISLKWLWNFRRPITSNYQQFHLRNSSIWCLCPSLIPRATLLSQKIQSKRTCQRLPQHLCPPWTRRPLAWKKSNRSLNYCTKRHKVGIIIRILGVAWRIDSSPPAKRAPWKETKSGTIQYRVRTASVEPPKKRNSRMSRIKISWCYQISTKWIRNVASTAAKLKILHRFVEFTLNPRPRTHQNQAIKRAITLTRPQLTLEVIIKNLPK